MTKLLFLDDETPRHDSFMHLCEKSVYQPGFRVAHCWNYNEFSALLDQEPNDWDVFFLDHDLGMTSFDGNQCVDYMIERNIRPKIVVVHSWNSTPAKHMRLKLDTQFIKNYYIPFGYEYPPEVRSYFQ